jgi:hypothetical protein
VFNFLQPSSHFIPLRSRYSRPYFSLVHKKRQNHSFIYCGIFAEGTNCVGSEDPLIHNGKGFSAGPLDVTEEVFGEALSAGWRDATEEVFGEALSAGPPDVTEEVFGEALSAGRRDATREAKLG